MTPARQDCVNVKILTLVTTPVDSLKGRGYDYQVLVSARSYNGPRLRVYDMWNQHVVKAACFEPNPITGKSQRGGI